jgi:2-polyprenyl-3-methyl-5-hydroxy-6-metoxy-1,4-benzoquinol methylase
MQDHAQNLPSPEQQRLWWNDWNGKFLQTLAPEKLRQRDTVLSLLQSLNLRRPQILEVGCANGWLCQKLAEFGAVTGIDIADESIAEARARVPSGEFFVRDFCSAESPFGPFDLAVTLGTLAHVPDQKRFIENLAAALKPGGHLILLTQNRFVYSRKSDVAPLGSGQLRHWLTMSQLRALVAPQFRIERATTIEPTGDMGFLRIVNSYRLNAALSRVVSPHSITLLKERAGLGQTLVLLAQRRQHHG